MILSIIFEFITAIVSFSAAILLFNKSKKSAVALGTIFLGMGILMLGVYALCTIIYSLILEELVIIFFMEIGMSCLVFGVLFLFLTMQVLIFSEHWIRKDNKWMWLAAICATVISIVLIVMDHIKVVEVATADTTFAVILPFALFAVFIGFILIYSVIALAYFGISKNKGDARRRMIVFFIGLLLLIGALVSEIIGNAIESDAITDPILFGLLAAASMCYALAFLKVND